MRLAWILLLMVRKAFQSLRWHTVMSFHAFSLPKGKEPKRKQQAGNGTQQHPYRATHPGATEGRRPQRELVGAWDWLLTQPSLQGVPQAFIGWRSAALHLLGHEFQLLPILYVSFLRRNEGEAGGDKTMTISYPSLIAHFLPYFSVLRPRDRKKNCKNRYP